jgi:hypothetical protein
MHARLGASDGARRQRKQILGAHRMHGIQLSFTLTGNINPALAAMFFNDLSPIIARYSPAKSATLSAPSPVIASGAEHRETANLPSIPEANADRDAASAATFTPPVEAQPTPPPLTKPRVRRTKEQIAADEAAAAAAANGANEPAAVAETVANSAPVVEPVSIPPATAAAPTSAAPTLDDLRAAYARLIAHKVAGLSAAEQADRNRANIKAVLAACGVAQFSAIKPEDFAKAIAHVDSLITA